MWKLTSFNHFFTLKPGQKFLTHGRSQWPMTSASVDFAILGVVVVIT